MICETFISICQSKKQLPRIFQNPRGTFCEHISSNFVGLHACNFTKTGILLNAFHATGLFLFVSEKIITFLLF